MKKVAVGNWIKDVLGVMLNFMFSKPSLKASLNLVSNCIPFGLFQRKTLFSEGLVNFKMFKSN